MSSIDSLVELLFGRTDDNDGDHQVFPTSAQAQKSPVNVDSMSISDSTGTDGLGGQDDQTRAETRTVTRTANFAGDGDGPVRTITRLSTQTGIVDVDASSSAETSPASASQSDNITSSSTASASDTLSVVKQAPAFANSSSVALPTNSSTSSGSTLIVNNAPTGAVATSPPDNGNVNQITTFTDTAQPTSRSMGQMMQMDTSLVTMSTATNNRAAASNSSPAPGNIFVPGHKLFPLGITVIVLGGLFVLISIGIILVRIFGWNRKCRLRLSIGSFMDVDPHSRFSPGNTTYEPNFETITTNRHIASTNPNPFEPPLHEKGSTRGVEGGYEGIGARRYDYPVDPFTYAGETRGPNQAINPFDPDQAPRGTSNLDVPTDVDMGSPVPSFNTGRMAYTYPNPSYTTNPDPSSSASSIVVARNLIGPAQTGSSCRSMSPLFFGTSPAADLGYLATQRGERQHYGSLGSIGGGSTYSTSSGGSDRIVWSMGGESAYTA